MSLWLRPPWSPPSRHRSRARSSQPLSTFIREDFFPSLQELIPTKPPIFHPRLCLSPALGAHRAGQNWDQYRTQNVPVWLPRVGLGQTQGQHQPQQEEEEAEEEEESNSFSEDQEFHPSRGSGIHKPWLCSKGAADSKC